MKIGRSGSLWALALVLSVGTAGSVAVLAQDHPEHPKEEHPTAREAVSKEALGEAIRAYVKSDSKLKGGYFLVYDGEARKPLVLTLAKVHDDKLAKVAEGTYFACADFKAEDGTVYDLDVFMKGDSPKSLTTTEITVHKESGKERVCGFRKLGSNRSCSSPLAAGPV